jgi:hypothetical protein
MIKKTFILLFIALIFYGCQTQHTPVEEEVINNICGQEPCYEGPFTPPWVGGLSYVSPWGDTWTHDNRVLETNNFLVFSDASTDDAKIRLGDEAEQDLAEIKQLFQITSQELGILDLNSKVTIYSSKRRFSNYNQAAGSTGFIIYAFDSPYYLEYTEEEKLNHLKVIKHEATHVCQSLMGGSFILVPTWFTEGLAEYVCGGSFTPITTWQRVEKWRQYPDHINPISIIDFNDFPVEYNRIGEYYAYFGLAIRYLMDSRGLGKTPVDIKWMFFDIAAGMTFNDAFKTHMGIPIEYFRENYYGLMKEYLESLPTQNHELNMQVRDYRMFESAPVSTPSPLP